MSCAEPLTRTMIDEAYVVYWILVLPRSSDAATRRDTAVARARRTRDRHSRRDGGRRLLQLASDGLVELLLLLDGRHARPPRHVPTLRGSPLCVKRAGAPSQKRQTAPTSGRGVRPAPPHVGLRLPRRLAGQLRPCALTSSLATQSNDATVAPTRRLSPTATKIVRAGASRAWCSIGMTPTSSLPGTAARTRSAAARA
jgi:hypothetical protein